MNRPATPSVRPTTSFCLIASVYLEPRPFGFVFILNLLHCANTRPASRNIADQIISKQGWFPVCLRPILHRVLQSTRNVEDPSRFSHSNAKSTPASNQIQYFCNNSEQFNIKWNRSKIRVCIQRQTLFYCQ